MAKRPHWLPDVMSMDNAIMIRAAGLSVDEVMEMISIALAEDLDGGVDVTSCATVPRDQVSQMKLVARKPGVVAGVVVAATVFDLVSQHEATCNILIPDGMPVAPGDVILEVTGRTQALLTAERTALNLLCHLSGIATATWAWVTALKGTNAQVRDTRKTTPGLRRLEKFAVRCGGGLNHRMSLSDAALVKDNHIVAAGGVGPAFHKVRQRFPELSIEVEVDNLSQLREVLDAGADLVLLDNFSVAETHEAVQITAGRAKLESSGGLTIERAREYGETGVDYIAVGAITHSAAVLDIGADLTDLEEEN